MRHLSSLILGALLALAAPVASAQCVIIFNDNTRVEVADTQIDFAGAGEASTTLRADGNSYNLCDIAAIEYAGPSTAPIVLAYHPYYSTKFPKPEMVTHINYGFAEVYVKDGVYNGFKLQSNERPLKRIVALKDKNPALKILLSFSHTVVNSDNAQDGGFSAIAANPEYRQAFADDCLKFLEKWGIDGIDLDWEFPGLSWSGAACDPVNDVANYTLLMQTLRETLGHRYLLTFAGYCMDKRSTSAGTRYIDLAAVEPYVDFINVMTYDLDEAPRFHNAIRSTASYFDIERTIAAYRRAGVPMSKVVLGIPFYARTTFSGPSLAYPAVKKLADDPSYTIDNWDESAQVPYITRDGAMYGSYDNEASILNKGDYAANQGLRGLFYWCTHEDDNNFTLARATWLAVFGR